MDYLLGTDAESIAFTDDGIRYQPAGTRHAVDIHSPANGPDTVLAYALCGRAVRVWADQHFDAHTPGGHTECVTRADHG